MKRAIAALCLAVLAACGPPSEKSKARDVIALCWQDHKQKSLDPAAQRFIAGTCERLEAEFRSKHGVNP